MIPAKIHYCWLSNDPFPEKIQMCINSWKKMLPDYEFVKWDLERFPLEKNLWVKQAYEKKKYAFAADYLRLYALVNEGGIYLDSDVEVLRPFDDLLHLPYFICKENSPKGIEAATMGAEKGCEWLKKCLSYYDGKKFVDDDGKYNTKVLPEIIKEQILASYSIMEVNDKSMVRTDPKIVYILPFDFFSPKNYISKKITITSNTYSIHHFAGTWQPRWKKFALLIWVPFSVKFPRVSLAIKKIIKCLY